MFGIRNLTKLSFIAEVGRVTLEFSVGMLEEVTLNATSTGVANAAEIPQNMNVNVISKDQLITTTSALVSSKIAQTKLVDVIAGATTNLLI